MTKKIRHTGNPFLFGIMIIAVIGLTFYSGYQTWGCVNWLYPNDQQQLKFITVFSFDGCAFLWAVTDLFYKCASRSTKNIIRAAVSIDFSLAACATILYLMVSNIFRYHGIVPLSYVQGAEMLSVVALMGNILFLSFFVSMEWKIRHPEEEYYLDEQQIQMSNTFAQTAIVEIPPIQNIQKELDTQKKRQYRKREKVVEEIPQLENI